MWSGQQQDRDNRGSEWDEVAPAYREEPYGTETPKRGGFGQRFFGDQRFATCIGLIRPRLHGDNQIIRAAIVFYLVLLIGLGGYAVTMILL